MKLNIQDFIDAGACLDGIVEIVESTGKIELPIDALFKIDLTWTEHCLSGYGDYGKGDGYGCGYSDGYGCGYCLSDGRDGFGNGISYGYTLNGIDSGRGDGDYTYGSERDSYVFGYDKGSNIWI